MKNILIALLFAVTLLAGCGKEKVDPVTGTITGEEIIVAANWKLVGYSYEAQLKTGGPTTTVNYFERLTCEKDDLYSFRADNQLVLDKNAVLCAGDEPKISVWSTWELTADDARLKLNRDGYSYFPFHKTGSSSFTQSFDVAKLTRESMVLKSNITRAADSVITITYSFVSN